MKKNLFLLAIPFFLFFEKTGVAQTKKIVADQQLWLGYLNQARFSEKWGITFDVSYRTARHLIQKPFQGVIRGGVMYYVSDKLRLAGGYAFFNHYPGISSRTVASPEHRLWKQVQWSQKSKWFVTRQMIRLEERWRKKYKDNDHLDDEYGFNYRFRYNLGFIIPLMGKESEPHSLALIVGDEFMINFGKQVVYNYFDQNRLYGNLGYQIDKNFNIQVGYIKVFQQQPSGNTFINADVLRITLLHNVDLRTSSED